MMKQWLVAVFFLGTVLTGHAQWLTPLASYPPFPSGKATHPARVSAVGDTLALPFFDDFANQPPGRADLRYWQQGGGALINNQFAIRPPSVGVATLEGIRGDGLPYSALTAYGYADTLTSKPLYLQNYNPLLDSVYLSFYWQAGGLAGSPDTDSNVRPVFLAVEFKDRNGAWQEVWRQNGADQVTEFTRENLRIQDPAYFYNGFQFRFRNSGVLKGSGDSWNIDYVFLQRKINPAKPLLEDVAMNQRLNSLLNRYTAMPAWQYAVNPAGELNDSLFATFNNLSNRFAPITWRGYTRVISRAQPADTFLRGNAAVPPLAPQVFITGTPAAAAIPASLGNDFAVQSVLFLNSRETAARTRQNDTIARVTEFKNYFAYDDGTAESNFSLDKTGQRQGAYAFEVNVPDQVRGLRVYLTKTNVAGHQIVFRVWDPDSTGNPAGAGKAQQGFVIPVVDSLDRFYDILFPTLVPVQGRFFVGWSLASNVADFVNFGFDLNEAAPAKISYNNNGTGWITFTGERGALMLRPIMDRVTGTSAIIADPRLVTAYPNPSPGQVYLRGPVTNWQVTDVTGKLMLAGRGTATGIQLLNLQSLTNGLYFIHCYTKKGIVIKKISLTR